MNFFRNLWDKILTLFGRKTETTSKQFDDNQKYAMMYQSINDINYTAIFSAKLSNYCSNQSSINVERDNKRANYLNDKVQEIWDDRKRIFNRMFGTGGVFIMPYYTKNEIQYTIIPQFRVSINERIGKRITNATVLSDVYTQKKGYTTLIYYRWTDYLILNNNLVINQRYTNENGEVVIKPKIWEDINDSFTITNVDRILGGYFKSPIDNRQNVDAYGVPITYGCESTIKEIKECLKQIVREFKAKEVFIGVDFTLFKDPTNQNKLGLPDDGIYRKFNGEKDDLWQVFDPAIRESSYYARLQELYARLEKQIGTSRGILTEIETAQATATAIRKALYDTFTIVDDARVAFEQAMEDVVYSIDVLANYYNVAPQGDYEINYEWGYDLLQDAQQDWNQLVQGYNLGIVPELELRQWLKPNEDIKVSEKVLAEIKENNPTVEELVGGDRRRVED